MENPVNTDYLQRPYTVDKRTIKSEGSDEEEDEEDKKHLNRNKVPLYKKPIRDIKKFPFMAGKRGDDDSDYENVDESREESREKPPALNRRNSPRQKAPADDDFGDFGGFGDDL